ncbi:MAG: methylenetetrahydrofolate reductase [NAD(P)H] [Planctomycetota bacterium]
MRISDAFGDTPVVSFEFFPPKDDEGRDKLFETIESLEPCRPTFVSVTYGAGGSTRDRTLDLVGRVKDKLGIEPMAHLTTVGSTKDEIREVLKRLVDLGVENVLALRGDPPKGATKFEPTPGGFGYANELVQFIRDEGFPLCVGAACYPEGHTEAEDIEKDLDYLKLKVDAGVDFLVSQLFFDNAEFMAFTRRARQKGIDCPIVPGLMPITNVSQVQRFTEMCGTRIPQELRRRLRLVDGDPSAVVATGVMWSTMQAQELLEAGADGIHFYTLNKSSATRAVHAALGL